MKKNLQDLDFSPHPQSPSSPPKKKRILSYLFNIAASPCKEPCIHPLKSQEQTISKDLGRNPKTSS